MTTTQTTDAAERVLIEARRRVLDRAEAYRARDADGDAELADAMAILAEDLDPAEYVPERDWADVHAFAALMGVTVGSRR